jgi:hypothetical protein
MYTLFTHQYLWNKFKWNFYLWGSLKDNVYRRKPATLDDLWESIAMPYAAITLDTLQNVVHAAVRRLWQCLDADGGHFEHLHWIQNSRISLISILLLYKYSSYDYRVIFFMSKCAYIFMGHSVYLYYTKDSWSKYSQGTWFWKVKQKLQLSLSRPWRHIRGVEVQFHPFSTRH